jgi:hypothetical protein
MEKEKVVTSPSSVYLTIDSKDRNQSTTQDWNNFTLQKPQALLDAFAKKLVVSEVRFPWYIPNITQNNNVFAVASKKGTTLDFLALITIPPGFYTPVQLVSAINTQIVAVGFDASPVLSYNNLSQTYTFTAGLTPSAEPFTLYFYNYAIYDALPSEPAYNTSPWLLRTLGFHYNQVSGSGIFVATTGQPTMSVYTNYVDIVSTRLTRFQKVRDGDSANNSQSNTICRIYLADEASNPLLGKFNLATTGTPDYASYGAYPLLIHRQFKNAKALNWTPDNFVDYLDIRVLDEYNNLVPLQTGSAPFGGAFVSQYPDFQITFICTE